MYDAFPVGGVSMEMSILAAGIVCTLYTALVSEQYSYCLVDTMPSYIYIVYMYSNVFLHVTSC